MNYAENSACLSEQSSLKRFLQKPVFCRNRASVNSVQKWFWTRTNFQSKFQTSYSCSLDGLLPLNQLRIKPHYQNLWIKPIFIEFDSNWRFEGSNLISANFEVDYLLEQVCYVKIHLLELPLDSQTQPIKIGLSNTQNSKKNALKHQIHAIQFKCSN